MPSGKRQPDDRTTRRIAQLVEEGQHPVTAARACGVSAKTFHDWIQLGETATEDEDPYAVFFRAVDEADARGEMALVARFSEATKGDWKAVESFAQRRYSRNWGNKQTTTVESQIQVSGRIDVAQALSTPGVIEALTQIHQQQAALGDGVVESDSTDA